MGIEWDTFYQLQKSLRKVFAGKFKEQVGEVKFNYLYEKFFLEAFESARRNFDDDVTNNPTGYLYRIIKNKFFGYLKKNKALSAESARASAESNPEDNPDEVSGNDEVSDNKEKAHFVMAISETFGHPLNHSTSKNAKFSEIFQYAMTSFKQEMWRRTTPIPEEIIKYLEQFDRAKFSETIKHEWEEPLSMVRLRSWSSSF